MTLNDVWPLALVIFIGLALVILPNWPNDKS